MIVEFIEVGRNKKSWELEIDNTVSVAQLELLITDEIRKKGKLISTGVGWYINPDTMEGSITAGFHKVGTIKVKHAENDSPLSIIRTLAKRMKD